MGYIILMIAINHPPPLAPLSLSLCSFVMETTLHPNYSRDVSNPFEKISVLEKNNKNNCQNQFFSPSALFPIFLKRSSKNFIFIQKVEMPWAVRE
jgi:hypothetical protein